MSDIQKRITLYAAKDSPYPHRVLLALEEAKASYDVIWIDLLDKPDWYSAVNKDGAKVPYLVYGGSKLTPGDAPSPDSLHFSESLLMLYFLADLFPTSGLLPADPEQRARARLFIHIADAQFVPAWAGLFFFGAPAEGLLAILERLQGMLAPPAEGGYALGPWSIADAVLVPFILRLDMMLSMGAPTMAPGADEEVKAALASARFSRLKTYLEDNKARASMASTYDEAAVHEKMVQRTERLRKTGVVTSEIKVPVTWDV